MMLHKKECDMYDERQIRERGMIFKTAFLWLVLYNFIIAILVDIANVPWFDYFTYSESNFIGIILSITICTIMMIIKNAYISPMKPYLTHISVSAMSVCGIGTLIGDIIYFDWFNFVISICITAICCTYWINFFCDRKNINVDDED